MINPNVIDEIQDHIALAIEKYGNYASTHEALGVALEEWDELRAAIRANALASVEEECIDLAAVLIKLAVELREHSRNLLQRSGMSQHNEKS